MWKKLIIGLLALILLLIVIMFFFGGRILDKAVREGASSWGPEVTGTPIEVGEVSVSPWNGRGEVSGLLIGNPEGYEGDYAIRVPTAAVEVELGSVLGETIVVERIHIRNPQVRLETVEERMNLRQIRDNIARTVGEEDPGPPRDRKKYIIREFILEGGKVSVRDSGLQESLPTVQLQGIGAQEGGILGEAAVQQIIDAVIEEMVPLLGEAAAGLVDDPEGAMSATERMTDALQSLFGDGDGDSRDGGN